MEVEQAIKRENNSFLIVMKHSCKFCHKRFPCGRSLGGHMKSHLITNPIGQEKVNTTINKHKQLISAATTTNSSSGEANYELRENPKKTWRAIGSTHEDSCNQDPNLAQFQDKSFCCKECGKAFHSSKALSGHMKSHAVEREKEKERVILVKENSFLGDLDNSYNNGPRRSSRMPRNMGFRTNDGNSNNYNSKIGSSSSSVSEIDDQQEQEEVALCLILLSGDLNSEFLETPPTIEEKGLNLFDRVWESELDQNLTSQNFLVQAEFAIETDKRKAKSDDDVLESDDKRSKFECTTCNKIFHSHQALGGHRASHKKTKGCFGKSEIQAPPVFHHHSQEKEISSRKVVEKHECPICCRVFPSGQALGGHKRSHFIVKSTSKSMDYSVEKSINTTTTTNSNTSTHEVRDFLDLNQPAPVEVEVVGLKPWWVESTSKHEQLLGMI